MFAIPSFALPGRAPALAIGRRRLVVSAALAVTLVVGLPSVVVGQDDDEPPSTLQGEIFDGFGGRQVSLSGDCEAPFEGRTFTVESTGPATGPYPGTFRETGNFIRSGRPREARGMVFRSTS